MTKMPPELITNDPHVVFHITEQNCVILFWALMQYVEAAPPGDLTDDEFRFITYFCDKLSLAHNYLCRLREGKSKTTKGRGTPRRKTREGIPKLNPQKSKRKRRA